MGRFISTVDVAAPVELVWERLTDWPAHERWIPLTSIRVTSDRPDGVGATFVARTGIGPIAFEDPMEIVEWTAPAAGEPGFCRVLKHGRVILGWASCEVVARPGGSRVLWTEDVRVAPVRLTRPIDRLITAGGRFGFNQALRAMAKEIETEVGPRV